MNQTEQAKRIEKLERQVMLLKTATDHDAVAIGKLRGRIEKLETCAVINAETIGQVELLKVAVASLWDTLIEQAEHIEKLEATSEADTIAVTIDHIAMTIKDVKKLEQRIEELEAALRDTVHCLIGGSVDVDKGANVVGTMFHSHCILGIGSATTMAKIYHRLNLPEK